MPEHEHEHMNRPRQQQRRGVDWQAQAQAPAPAPRPRPTPPPRPWPATLAEAAADLAAKGEPYRWLPCGCLLVRCRCCGDWSATIGDGSCRLGDPLDPRHRWLCQEFAPSGSGFGSGGPAGPGAGG